MMKKKQIKIPIYKQTLVILLANDLQGVIDKFDLVCNCENPGAITFFYDGKIYVAFDNEAKLSYINHETCHVVNTIYDNIGADNIDLGGEPHAYLTEYIFELIYKTLNIFMENPCDSEK